MDLFVYLGYVIVYLLLGLFWSFYKWYLLLKENKDVIKKEVQYLNLEYENYLNRDINNKEKFEEFKNKMIKDNQLVYEEELEEKYFYQYNNYIKDNKMSFEEFKFKILKKSSIPSLSKNKGWISSLILFWPISSFLHFCLNFFTGTLYRFIKKIIHLFREVYQSITDSKINSIKKEIGLK